VDLLSFLLTVKQLSTKLLIHHLALEMGTGMAMALAIPTILEMVMVFLRITGMEIDMLAMDPLTMLMI